MKKVLFALAADIAVTSVAQADFPLESLVRGAASEVVRSVVSDAPQQRGGEPATGTVPAAPASAASTSSSAPKAGCFKTRAKPLPPLGPRPDSYAPEILWPEDTGCDYYKFSDLKFDKGKAQKKAFEDASKVACSDCEGGYSFDAWAHFFLIKGGNSYEKFTPMLIALKPGQSLSWKGARYSGTVQATGEHPIGPYPCRQYHWTLKSGKNVVAEREGLYCEVKGEYAASATWREVL
ncbi:MAG: hypothetical protein PHT19_07765 [Methylococcus sp.]|nr:hypothetical protein [Methylococcus sp.]